jgi:hypothetical protein
MPLEQELRIEQVEHRKFLISKVRTPNDKGSCLEQPCKKQQRGCVGKTAEGIDVAL